MAKSNSTKSKNVCQVKDCEGKYHAKGWCIKHYTQMLRHGEINDERTIRLCSLDGCGRKHYAKDYCRKHYMQVWCYGKLLKHTKFDPNEFRFDGGDCYMMLYDQIGNPRVETVFDITDYEKVSAYKWCLVHNYCRCISLNIGLSVFLMSPIPEGLIVDNLIVYKFNYIIYIFSFE